MSKLPDLEKWRASFPIQRIPMQGVPIGELWKTQPMVPSSGKSTLGIYPIRYNFVEDEVKELPIITLISTVQAEKLKSSPNVEYLCRSTMRPFDMVLYLKSKDITEGSIVIHLNDLHVSDGISTLWRALMKTGTTSWTGFASEGDGLPSQARFDFCGLLAITGMEERDQVGQQEAYQVLKSITSATINKGPFTLLR